MVERPRSQSRKSFLLLFFKKEVLPCLPIRPKNTRYQPLLIRRDADAVFVAAVAKSWDIGAGGVRLPGFVWRGAWTVVLGNFEVVAAGVDGDALVGAQVVRDFVLVVGAGNQRVAAWAEGEPVGGAVIRGEERVVGLGGLVGWWWPAGPRLSRRRPCETRRGWPAAPASGWSVSSSAAPWARRVASGMRVLREPAPVGQEAQEFFRLYGHEHHGAHSHEAHDLPHGQGAGERHGEASIHVEDGFREKVERP